MIEKPTCPGPECKACNGEACGLCGAGCWSKVTTCEHDVIQRHQDGLAPDKHCVSMPDGSCESTDPRDMHAGEPVYIPPLPLPNPSSEVLHRMPRKPPVEVEEMLKAPDIPGMPPLSTPLPAKSYNIQALRKEIREAARLLNICDMEFAKGSRTKAALLFGAAYGKMRIAVEVIAHGYEE